MRSRKVAVIDDASRAGNSVIQHEPYAILIDLKILRRSGCEIANGIKRVFETSRVPIITMSELVKVGSRELLSLFGIKRHLKKPFHPLDVIWTIENEIIEGDHRIGRLFQLKMCMGK